MTVTAGSAIDEIVLFGVGIAISPIPIVVVILILFSARGRSNGPAFLVGWVVGLVLIAVVVVLVSEGGEVDSERNASDAASAFRVLLGLLLLALAVYLWRRGSAHGDAASIPKWMGAVDDLTPLRAGALGCFLSALSPKNIALAIGAALAVAETDVSTGGTAVFLVVFVALASVTLGGAVLYCLLGGDAARERLDQWKEWLTQNSATVMTVLLVVIGFSLLSQGIGGLVDQ
jgi:hypothetical protein